MILILSDESDYSTNQVIDWILYYKKEFVRINPTYPVSIKEMELNGSTEKVVLKLRQYMVKKYK